MMLLIPLYRNQYLQREKFTCVSLLADAEIYED